MVSWVVRTSLALALTFAISSPALAQVTVGAGGTGTTANTGASGQILVGQGNGTFLEKAMSGDCTLAATGAITCSASSSSMILDIGDDAGNDSTALAEIATSGDTNGIVTEPSADKMLIDMSKDWPKADAADALNANGANCSAGQYPLGVDAAGAVESCTADDDNPDSDAEVPNGITVDISAGGQITGGTASRCARFDASGVLGVDTTDCSSGAGDVVGPASANDNAICRFNSTTGKLIQNSGCTLDDSGNLDCAGTIEGSCTPASSDCGMTTDDNASDAAAPGAGLTTWYSKAGEPYIRAGAAGSATKVCTAADIASCTAGSGDMTKAAYDSDSDNQVNEAEALAANGANCSAGNYPLGVDAAGAVESCTAAPTECSSSSCALNSATTASTAAADDSDTSVATTAFVQQEINGAGGTGVACSSGSCSTASGEQGFIAAGALTCGASTNGKMQVHTTPLQYCDNAATPALQYAAYGNSSGVATSATALAANGANCSAGQYPLGVDTAGAVESCTADDDVPEAADYSNLTAGRSLTAPSTGTVDADAELYTDEVCIYKTSPASSDQYYTVWYAPVALTVTSIYCEVTGGTSVGADLNIDDGTPAGINGSDITCDTTGVTDSTLAGDTTMAAGDRLDVDVGTVTGSVTSFSICMKYTKDD